MKTPIRILAMLFALCGWSQAASITINNSSFETDSDITGPGGWSNSLVDWEERDGFDDGDSFAEYISGFAAEGNNHVGMNAGYYIWQDTGVAWAPNTTYTLQVAGGNRSGQSGLNDNIYGLLNGTPNVGDHPDAVSLFGSSVAVTFESWNAPANTAAGTFADATPLIFTTGAVAPAGNVIVALGATSSTGRAHYDNIRLDATAVPEPSTALLGLAGLLVLARRRR